MGKKKIICGVLVCMLLSSCGFRIEKVEEKLKNDSIGTSSKGLVINEKSQQEEINLDVNEVKEFNSNEIKNIQELDLEIVGGLAASVVEEKRDDIRVEIIGNVRSEKPPKFQLDCEIKGNKLKVKATREEVIASSFSIGLINMEDVKVAVYVPEGKIKTMISSATTGDISIKDMKLNSLKHTSTTGDYKLLNATGSGEISTSTGDVVISNSSLEDLQVETTTGDIGLDNYKGKVKINSNTGDITVTNGTFTQLSCYVDTSDISFRNIEGEVLVRCSTGNLEISDSQLIKLDHKASTGDVYISNVTGNIYSETSTGDIELKLHEINDDIRLTTSTGGIGISLPKESGFTLDARTGSGEVYNDSFIENQEKDNSDRVFEGVNKNGDSKIEIRSSNGDIVIK